MKQLSSNHDAVLVLKFVGIREPNPFQHSDWLKLQ